MAVGLVIRTHQVVSHSATAEACHHTSIFGKGTSNVDVRWMRMWHRGGNLLQHLSHAALKPSGIFLLTVAVMGSLLMLLLQFAPTPTLLSNPPNEAQFYLYFTFTFNFIALVELRDADDILQSKSCRCLVFYRLLHPSPPVLKADLRPSCVNYF